MEVLLQCLDELDDACHSLLFLASKPGLRPLLLVLSGFTLAACGSFVG